MNKFPLKEFKEFADLPLDHFRHLDYSVYVLDKKWNYLFVNDFAKVRLGLIGIDMKGINMWEYFEQLGKDPAFLIMKRNSENGHPTDVVTNSPISSKQLNIIGKPLKDCYIFYVSQIPDRQALINELRNEFIRKEKDMA